MKSTKRDSGFTLAELLIVVGIIGLLVGIMVPSMVRAKKVTKRTVCLQQLKSVSTGLLSYAISHQGYLPPTAQRTHTNERPDLSANIVFHRDLDFDLTEILRSYVPGEALVCPEPGGLVVEPYNPRISTVYSNYVFLWGAASGTPEKGYTKLDHAPPRSVTVADLTWNIYHNGQWVFGGNHLKSGRHSYRPSPFVLAGENDEGGLQYNVPTLKAIYGLNAAYFDGSAAWAERESAPGGLSGRFTKASTGTHAYTCPPGGGDGRLDAESKRRERSCDKNCRHENLISIGLEYMCES